MPYVIFCIQNTSYYSIRSIFRVLFGLGMRSATVMVNTTGFPLFPTDKIP